MSIDIYSTMFIVETKYENHKALGLFPSIFLEMNRIRLKRIINKKEKDMGISVKRLCGIIFMAVGIVMIVNAISYYNKETDFENNCEETTANVTRIDKKNGKKFGKSTKYYTAYVSFKVGENEYEDIRLDRRTTSVNKGSTVEILYDKSNPSDIRRASSFNPAKKIYTSIGTFGVGAAFFVISLFTDKKKNKLKYRGSKRAKLVETGDKYKAKVVNVIQDRYTKYKGQNPYIVECVMINPQTGKEEKYRSLYVARDLANVDLQMVDVYISKENPAIYYVDVEGTLDAIKTPYN